MEPSSLVTVITGSAQGIGRRTAKLCAERGDAVALLDLQSSPVPPGADALVLTGDLSDENWNLVLHLVADYYSIQIDVLDSGNGYNKLVYVPLETPPQTVVELVLTDGRGVGWARTA